MPELAEVEFFRRTWSDALKRARIIAVESSGKRPVKVASGALAQLKGLHLVQSEAAAKQMLFRFQGTGHQAALWLGVHLGMSGELRAEPPGYVGAQHDHLILRTRDRAAVYTDPRMFGRVDLHVGEEPPLWWTRIAPAVLSPAFTAAAVAAYLRRRRRTPLKAILLQQERFPGIGNWMADEILWRARLHPARLAKSLHPAEVAALWRQCREVCRVALRVIGGKGGALPPGLNSRIPHTWLFHHRWSAGGRDPKTGGLLKRATIGGRTTCWSPDRQTLRPA
jgi:formamidopyrimidine-DNA glycosylase